MKVVEMKYECPVDISPKDVSCLAFYFKCKYFVLTDHILSEPFFFNSVICSQLRTLELNLRPKFGLTYAISTVK